MLAGESLAAPLGPVTVKPVWLNGCLAWLHTPGQASADTAILVCPPVSWDALHSHHSLRVMADAFAAAGYPTLRFNYPGTGDSADLCVFGEEAWAAWRQSLHAAADWLRAAVDVERVVFAGLRLGAALTTVVAQSRGDVAGLILLAPVVRGQSYIRQLSIEAQIEYGGLASSTPAAAGLTFLDLQFSAETVAQVAAVDLRRAKLRAGLAVAVFLQAPSRPAEEAMAEWRRCGADVAQFCFGGLEALLRQTAEHDPPPFDPAPILRWLRATVPTQHCRRAAPGVLSPGCNQLDRCTETVLRFGPGDRLAGLLCQPIGATPPLRRAVLILNTGRLPHYGLARFGVELARRLAAAGFASLRFDFAGLGDSLGPVGQENVLSPLWAANRSADITAAVNILEQRGYSRFAVQGLCSGAYHALHGALADVRIDMLLLVNLPLFRWHSRRLLDLPRHCGSQLRQAAFWRRMLAGQVPLHRITATVLGRVWEKLQHRAALPAIPLSRSGPYRALSTLSGRNVHTHFLYAAGDSGLAAMEEAFGRIERGVARFPGVHMHVVPGLDHVLTGAAMRQTVASLLLGFLLQAEAGAACPEPAARI